MSGPNSFESCTFAGETSWFALSMLNPSGPLLFHLICSWLMALGLVEASSGYIVETIIITSRRHTKRKWYALINAYCRSKDDIAPMRQLHIAALRPLLRRVQAPPGVQQGEVAVDRCPQVPVQENQDHRRHALHRLGVCSPDSSVFTTILSLCLSSTHEHVLPYGKFLVSSTDHFRQNALSSSVLHFY